jgi:hypothetical protein
MCAAILAAVIATFLSLGGASFVLAGGPQGNGGGNGNGNGHAQAGSQAPSSAPAAAPAPAPSAGDSGKAKSNNGGGQQKHAAAAPQSQPAPAPAQPKHADAPQSQPAQPKHASTPAPSAPTSTGGGSHSTATSGPGSSGQGCDGSHNSNTGHGANHSGPYDNTCDGSPSLNGNGNGQATGKPCAGCVGNADDKNPKGQYPNGSDHNAGYECDRNHGIGRSNPAHTGCTQTTTTPPPPGGGDCTSDCGGSDCTTNCCTENCGPVTCPDGSNLSTALTHSAALALKVLSVLHPEFAKLSDAAVSAADDKCGSTPPPTTYCQPGANGSYSIATLEAGGTLPAGAISPVPADGCPKGSTEGEHSGCPTDMTTGDTSTSDENCGKCPTDMSGDAGSSNDNGCGHTPITICHATGSATNPFVEITIDENGLNGHGDHPDDIIPAPAGGCPGATTSNSPMTYCKPNGSGGYTVETSESGTLPEGAISPVPAGGCPVETISTPPGTPPVIPPTVLGTSESGPTPTATTPNEQAVLGVRENGSTAPAATTAPATNEVLGTRASGGTTTPVAATAPAAVNRAVPAAKAGGTLPFTGTDAMLVLFLGCLLVLGGVALHTVTTRRSTN